jgi:hypothetical protein
MGAEGESWLDFVGQLGDHLGVSPEDALTVLGDWILHYEPVTRRPIAVIEKSRRERKSGVRRAVPERTTRVRGAA